MKFGITKRALSIFGASMAAMSLLTLAACNNDKGGSATKAGATPYELASDLPEGSKDAKVVMVEYASVMCPHCADFQKDIIPQIMENYVKTGKVRYVFREFPTQPVELATAGHLIARCVAKDKREAVISALMSNQKDIFVQAQAGAGVKSLMTVAASAGMSEADFEKCLSDKEKLKTLEEITQYGSDHDKVTGTPTILINGATYTPPEGKGYEYAEMAKALDAAIAKAK